MSILEEIILNKRLDVEKAIQKISLAEMRAKAARVPPARDFIGAILTAHKRNAYPALIAEIKAASPSRGVLVHDFDPLRLAEIFDKNGATAVSVLTEEHYFKGHLDYLQQVRAQFPNLPLLRKDFIFDPYQIYEARAAGADAVILIAAALEQEQLVELLTLAQRLGMAVLVEVHTREELQKASACQASLIGINNRNLHTFETSIQNTFDLLPLVQPHMTVVAESGIQSSLDVERLYRAGVHAVLIGEALVTATDPAAKVRAFTGQSTRPV
jgi:indole-3-glycerol phosphate synthase